MLYSQNPGRQASNFERRLTVLSKGSGVMELLSRLVAQTSSAVSVVAGLHSQLSVADVAVACNTRVRQ